MNTHTPPQFVLVRFNDVSLSTTAAYLIRDLIPRVGLTIVWGPKKQGKSYWVFDAMMHVALGWSYRGRKVVQGPVVYLVLEGYAGFRARIAAFRQRQLSAHTEPVPFWVVNARVDLINDHPALVESIRQQVTGQDPVAVVIDTLNRSIAGSESDDEDMRAFIDAADAIRDAFDCAVIVVHHSGLDASRPRGHTALGGSADAQIAVKRPKRGGFIVAEVEFMKDGPEGGMIASRLEAIDVGKDDDGDTITACVVVPADLPAASPPFIKGQAAAALDCLRQALQDAGEAPPAIPGLPSPAAARAVKDDRWRQQCGDQGLTTTRLPDAERRAFTRAKSDLVKKDLVQCWRDWVWIP